MNRILITGANGFVGKVLSHNLLEAGYFVRATLRSKNKTIDLSKAIECMAIGNINDQTDWHDSLTGIDVVVHLASRVHIMQDASINPLDEYRKVNTEGTKRLIESAVSAGVRRIVFLSTIKVNGEETRGQLFSESDMICPCDSYAISKHEAELILYNTAMATGIEVVILRPPLVYGPGVKANFLRLLDMVNKNIPMPLALVMNKRSMIYVGNLTDAIIKCMEHTDAANKTFLVSDGQDVSTPELIKMIAKTMGKTAKLLPVPSAALKVLGRISGKQLEVERLIGSLQIDNSKIRRTLDWIPPFAIEEGVYETVKWYMNTYEYGGRG